MSTSVDAIRLQWRVTTTPDLSGFLFFVEAGSTFDADDYAVAYSLNRADLDDQDISGAQNAAARLRDGEWLQVEHSAPDL